MHSGLPGPPKHVFWAHFRRKSRFKRAWERFSTEMVVLPHSQTRPGRVDPTPEGPKTRLKRSFWACRLLLALGTPLKPAFWAHLSPKTRSKHAFWALGPSKTRILDTFFYRKSRFSRAWEPFSAKMLVLPHCQTRPGAVDPTPGRPKTHLKRSFWAFRLLLALGPTPDQHSSVGPSTIWIPAGTTCNLLRNILLSSHAQRQKGGGGIGACATGYIIWLPTTSPNT